MEDVQLWAYIDVCNGGDVDAMWLTEADHLAALERVRVEALREARAAVDRVPSIDFGELPGGAPTVTDRRPQRVKADSIAAIDRLINAATTGDTDD